MSQRPKETHKTKKKPGVGSVPPPHEVPVMIRRMPATVRNLFKALCAKHGIPMSTAMIDLMRHAIREQWLPERTVVSGKRVHKVGPVAADHGGPEPEPKGA